jgi:uncharacterized repeat protein (TIGR04052 family)
MDAISLWALLGYFEVPRSLTMSNASHLLCRRSSGILAGICASITVVCACSGPAKNAVAIQFALSPHSAANGAQGDSAHVHDLRFYVHDVVLLAENRELPLTLTTNEWQDTRLVLIDMTGSSADDTNAAIRGTTAESAGAYTGVRFVLGVPFEMNHADPLSAASPLNRGEMFWVWQSGYKFLRADLDDADRQWSFHLGSTGCVSASAVRPPRSPCSQPNTVTIELRGFDPTQRAIHVRVDEIIRAMRASDHRTCTGNYAQDPACAAGYGMTGLELNTGRCGANACEGQRLFTAPP